MRSATIWMTTFLLAGLFVAPPAAADANSCYTSSVECTFHCHAGQLVWLHVYQEDTIPGSSAGSASCGTAVLECANGNGDCYASATTATGGQGVCTRSVGRAVACGAA